MGRHKQPKPFEFPEKLLTQIDEMAGGGFALFTFDDMGNPTIHFNCDNPIVALALQNHIKNWITAVENISLQVTTHNLLSPPRK